MNCKDSRLCLEVQPHLVPVPQRPRLISLSLATNADPEVTCYLLLLGAPCLCLFKLISVLWVLGDTAHPVGLDLAPGVGSAALHTACGGSARPHRPKVIVLSRASTGDDGPVLCTHPACQALSSYTSNTCHSGKQQTMHLTGWSESFMSNFLVYCKLFNIN